MISIEERNNLIIQLGKEGKKPTEILNALSLQGYTVSRERIRQLMHKLKIHAEAFEIRSEETNKKNMEFLQKNAGSFSLDVVDSLKFVAAKHKFTRKKASALQQGSVFDLEFEDVVWPDVCPVLGIVLDYTATGKAENSPSFDQIDPGKGYVKGNVMIMSWRANRIKNNGTAEEHRRIAEFMELDFEEVFEGIEGRLSKLRQEEKDNWGYYLSSDYLAEKERHTQSSYKYRNGYEHLSGTDNGRGAASEREQQRLKEIIELARQGFKQCGCCKQVLPRTEFHKHSGSMDGLGSWCKQCKRSSKEDKAKE